MDRIPHAIESPSLCSDLKPPWVLSRSCLSPPSLLTSMKCGTKPSSPTLTGSPLSRSPRSTDRLRRSMNAKRTSTLLTRPTSPPLRPSSCRLRQTRCSLILSNGLSRTISTTPTGVRFLQRPHSLQLPSVPPSLPLLSPTLELQAPVVTTSVPFSRSTSMHLESQAPRLLLPSLPLTETTPSSTPPPPLPQETLLLTGSNLLKISTDPLLIATTARARREELDPLP